MIKVLLIFIYTETSVYTGPVPKSMVRYLKLTLKITRGEKKLKFQYTIA